MCATPLPAAPRPPRRGSARAWRAGAPGRRTGWERERLNLVRTGPKRLRRDPSPCPPLLPLGLSRLRCAPRSTAAAGLGRAAQGRETWRGTGLRWYHGVPRRGAGGATAEPEDGALGARRQRSPLGGRGLCALCLVPGRAAGPRPEGGQRRAAPVAAAGTGRRSSTAPRAARPRQGPGAETRPAAAEALGPARSPRPPIPEAARRGAPPAEGDAEPSSVCCAALKNPLRKDEGVCKCVAPPCLCL